MKTIDIMNKQFSVLNSVNGFNHHQGVSDYTQTKMNLNQILDLGYMYKDKIDILRSMVYHSDEQKSYKEVRSDKRYRYH